MTGYEVKKLRRLLELSQGKFCRLLGVSVITLSRWENNRQRIGNLARMRIEQVAKEKGISWENLKSRLKRRTNK